MFYLAMLRSVPVDLKMHGYPYSSYTCKHMHIMKLHSTRKFANVHSYVSGDALSRGTGEMEEEAICPDVCERERETYRHMIKRYISVSQRLILDSPSHPRPRHAKWIQHKCLLLFNFYVPSIKYHKPLHLDDMVLKLSNLFMALKWKWLWQQRRKHTTSRHTHNT